MFNLYEKKIIEELSRTLDNIKEDEISELIHLISNADRVFFVGVGRVLLSLESIAKRLNHLGIDTVIVGQITEPAITSNDLLIVGSGSGETGFPLFIASKAKTFNAKIAHIGTNPASSMSSYSDLFIHVPASNKYDASINPSVQPMTSLFEQSLLILGDTLAMMLIDKEDIDISSLWQYHANLE